MERVIPRQGQERLRRRGPLPVDATRRIAIKRDVHEFEVDVDAATFAAAFREVLTDPQGTFGLIRVKRPAERLGLDFEVGERFQGCFSLEMLVRGRLSQASDRVAQAATSLLRQGWVARLVTWLEDQLLSDYAEIEAIELDPDLEGGNAFEVRYAYLDGTPIAGSTTFTVEPIGPARCRVRQVLEYQEVNGMALATFQGIGLKMHDQVVHQQVAQAAARAGGSVMRGTIPRAYQGIAG